MHQVKYFRAVILTALVFSGLTTVFASGLQVSPVSVTLSATHAADGLWLSNTGDQVLHAQVRVFRWTQVDGKDVLTPSQDLVISPPMLSINPQAQQLVRTIRMGPPLPVGSAEESYRLLIDELPVNGGKKSQLQFVLHYSVPVFVQSQVLESDSTKAENSALRGVTLSWSLHQDGDVVSLDVSNAGTAHAQLASIDFVDKKGEKHSLNPGLLGYVLPGSRMRWVLKSDAKIFSNGGTLESLVNGEEVKQPLSLVPASH